MFFDAWIENDAVVAQRPKDDWDGGTHIEYYTHHRGKSFNSPSSNLGTIVLNNSEFAQAILYSDFVLDAYNYYYNKTNTYLEKSWFLYNILLSYGAYATKGTDGTDVIVLPKNMPYPEETVTHEYGHVVNQQIGSRGFNTGGTHYGFSRYNPELAFSEGFATYFSCKVRNSSSYHGFDLLHTNFGNTYNYYREVSQITPSDNSYEGFENESLTTSFLLYVASTSQKETDFLNALGSDVWTLGRKPVNLFEFLKVVSNSSNYIGSSTRSVRDDLHLSDGDIYFATPSDNVQNIINSSVNGSLVYLLDGDYTQNMHFINRHGALYGRAFHKVTVHNPNKQAVPNTIYFNSTAQEDISRVYGIKVMDGMTGVDAGEKNPIFVSACRFTNNDHGVCSYKDVWVNNSIFDLNNGSGVILPPNVTANSELKARIVNNIFIGGQNAIWDNTNNSNDIYFDIYNNVIWQSQTGIKKSGNSTIITNSANIRNNLFSGTNVTSDIPIHSSNETESVIPFYANEIGVVKDDYKDDGYTPYIMFQDRFDGDIKYDDNLTIDFGEEVNNVARNYLGIFGNNYGIVPNDIMFSQDMVDNTLPTTISSNKTISGYWVANANVTISSGATLTIQEGTEIVFNNNSKIIVNGALTAIGTSSNSIKFTSNSSWGGITIQSPGNGTLKYCEIENASYGIKIYNSDPYIEQCYIHDNSYGVYVLGSSSPVFYWNTISDNTYGVKVTSGGTPYFGEEHTPPGTAKHGYNDIVDNNYGLYAYGSTIFLGNDMMAQIIGGLNTLDNNTTRDIHVFSSTTVWAEWNWWNGGASIYASSSSNVYKTFNYWTDPNGGSSLAKSSGEIIDDSTPFDPKNMDLDHPKDVYHLALYYKYQGQTEKAEELLNSILKDFSKSSYSSDALIHLYDISRRGGDIEIEEICKTKIGERAESVPQKKTSLDILASKYMREGKLLEAEKMCKSTIELYPNTDNEKYALFNMFLIKRQSEDTIQEVDEYKTRLEEKYPNDFVTLMAKSQFGEEVDWSKVKELGKENNDETKNTTEEAVPDKYVLNPAYPNPFNPSTTLSYALPFNSNVALTIYNLNGQVIRNYTINLQPSGTHKVIWDGTNSNGVRVATGIYIYRFEATSLETNEHFVKSEKLMLVK